MSGQFVYEIINVTKNNAPQRLLAMHNEGWELICWSDIERLYRRTR